MLKKVRNLRAVKPGQWVRTRVPDYECWQKPGDWSEVEVGREVDACVCPIYVPLPESQDGFHWRYRAAIRRIGRKWACHTLPGGYHIGPCDLGMVEGQSKPFWDGQEYRDFLDGKGIWLYEPASDDPELCPGPDCSIYLCDTCGEYRMPWSDDDGNLLCRECEVAGLVIHPDVVDRLEQVREFARQIGMSEQLEQQLNRMAGGTFFGRRSQCVLTGDFAPHSFTFCHYILPEGAEEKRRMAMNGGLIFQGPGLPADGSFPSLTVSLASGTGWFCHT